MSVREYFERVEKISTNPATGISTKTFFDVCKLFCAEDKLKGCKKEYKFTSRSGTANLKRHILNKHSSDVELSSYFDSIRSTENEKVMIVYVLCRFTVNL